MCVRHLILYSSNCKDLILVALSSRRNRLRQTRLHHEAWCWYRPDGFGAGLFGGFRGGTIFFGSLKNLPRSGNCHWDLREFFEICGISMGYLLEIHGWLVVWNILYFPIYIGNNHPNWLSNFSEIFRGVAQPPTRHRQLYWIFSAWNQRWAELRALFGDQDFPGQDLSVSDAWTPGVLACLVWWFAYSNWWFS